MYVLKKNGKELSRHPDASGCIHEVIRRENNPQYLAASLAPDGYEISSVTLEQMQEGAEKADAFFDKLSKLQAGGKRQ